MLLLIFTALALSVDGFAAGLALGLRGVRIGGPARAAIALLSAAFAAIAVTAGSACRALIPPSAANLLGAGILIALGGFSLLRALLPKKEGGCQSDSLGGQTAAVLRDPGDGDLDHSGAIDLKEALLLGFSLSVDMLGAGIGLALGASVQLLMLLPLAVGAAQTCCLLAGGAIGRGLSTLPVRRCLLDCLSGLLLMALGAVRLFV